MVIIVDFCFFPSHAHSIFFSNFQGRLIFSNASPESVFFLHVLHVNFKVFYLQEITTNNALSRLSRDQLPRIIENLLRELRLRTFLSQSYELIIEFLDFFLSEVVAYFSCVQDSELNDGHDGEDQVPQ